ncbi:DUF5709 domain-containing protein [Streptomyces boncukensis]|uniref:DUF5709 domain-containing protein n=1 Tax=Streptomyces boncukensis TaxID=2711219 RepID=A0A6G4X0E1_9ACTN|nr:DUF5709 domain-containing protein [Streptomyces boncukensis]NGO70214.1 hypothetical protein [Streptomyces boncukensis]
MTERTDGFDEPGPAEDDGVLEPADSLETDQLDADPLDTGIVPPDHWSRAEFYGNTAEEARRGESLDQHLAAEEPERPGPVSDSWAEGPAPRTGRLTAGDAGCHPVRDSEILAYDAGVDGGAASAEEAAVHVVEDEDAWEEESAE